MEREDTCNPQGNIDQIKSGRDRLTSLGPVGAVITAILASVCCVGPFVLVMLGVSGAWMGNLRAFEPYRPFLILLTLSFLAAGFYRVYRRPSGDCKPGSPCSISLNPKTKKVLWIITVFVVILLIFPYLIALGV